MKINQTTKIFIVFLSFLLLSVLSCGGDGGDGGDGVLNVCRNGTSLVSESLVSDEQACERCDDGFFLITSETSKTCFPLPICTNGSILPETTDILENIPVSYELGNELCQTCDDGYILFSSAFSKRCVSFEETNFCETGFVDYTNVSAALEMSGILDVPEVTLANIAAVLDDLISSGTFCEDCSAGLFLYASLNDGAVCLPKNPCANGLAAPFTVSLSDFQNILGMGMNMDPSDMDVMRMNGDEFCVSCNEGFGLSESFSCLPTVYTCENGSPLATGTVAGNDGDNLCGGCNSGYFLNSTNTCEPAIYTCVMGAPADAGTMGGHRGDNFCQECDTGYVLDPLSASCRPEYQFSCENGFADDGGVLLLFLMSNLVV